jgi:elongation factor Ts
LVELSCETEVVAYSDQLRRLAHDVAMQVAATDPSVVALRDDTEVEHLLDQPFIRDPGRTIRNVITDAALATGETITIRRFVRFEIGS